MLYKNRGNYNSPYSLKIMVNYHHHCENRVINWWFPSIPDVDDLDHLSPSPQRQPVHLGDRDAWSTMEGSGVHHWHPNQDWVTFHDVLHGFCASRGTGMAIMEPKMVQELASIDHDPLFLALLDLQKAYNTLEHGRLLQNLEGYGAGPNMRSLLE